MFSTHRILRVPGCPKRWVCHGLSTVCQQVTTKVLMILEMKPSTLIVHVSKSSKANYHQSLNKN